MIRNFSASYAGHVVDQDLGLEGTPANDRWYSNEQLIETFDWALDISKHIEKLGYQEFWMAEHHFQTEGYEAIPNLIMLGLYLSTQTEKLKFGCGFNIVPMWHPLRLAEDFAMADVLSKGRIIFGVGRGYHTREVESFGAPMLDSDANRELFEEQVEVIIKAFTQETFSHHGKHYELPPDVPYRGYQLKKLTLVPRPVTQPVDIWQPLVSPNPRGIDFMARMGIKPLIANNPDTALEEKLKMLQSARASHGNETVLGEDTALGVRMFIAESKEKAIKQARPYFEEAMKFAGPLGVMPLTPEQNASVVNKGRTPGVALPTLDEAVEAGSWLCGTSEHMVEHFKGIEEKYPGIERVNVAAVMGMPLQVFKDQLSIFAEEVMPAFKG
ncbi:MAG: LLM class flavin-dependent oxidoreductase [Chloroflexi bacterium]|nr:LLM class flavin-dependent oxidoreductase [Chloroflexota bacterium]